MAEYRDRGTLDLGETDVRLPGGSRLTKALAEELAGEVLERTGRQHRTGGRSLPAQDPRPPASKPLTGPPGRWHVCVGAYRGTCQVV